MTSRLPALSYDSWSETCDTLHAHTQLLGKLAVKLAPPEPQLQHAALRVTPEERSPYRGRSTPVNGGWGSFERAASLFSGQRAEPPSRDFIMRNSMDAEEVAVGWWPGGRNYNSAAFYAYAHPAPEGFASA